MQQINEKIKTNIEDDEKQNDQKTYFEKLYEDLKIGFYKNYKTLILITVVSVILLYLNVPEHIKNSKYVKGMYGSGMPPGITNNMIKGAVGENVGNEAKKKKGFLTTMSSPLSGATNIMMWIGKNILLLYLFLLFITVVPSIPVILYITVFYFIMSSLLGKISTF